MNEPNVKLHKKCAKQLARLSERQRTEVIDTIELFLNNPTDPSLRNHELEAEWAGYRSISVEDDLRLHFKILKGGVVYFVALGTHSQLYK
jgi:addiction module RelE/StbE family toxin